MCAYLGGCLVYVCVRELMVVMVFVDVVIVDIWTTVTRPNNVNDKSTLTFSNTAMTLVFLYRLAKSRAVLARYHQNRGGNRQNGIIIDTNCAYLIIMIIQRFCPLSGRAQLPLVLAFSPVLWPRPTHPLQLLMSLSTPSQISPYPAHPHSRCL